MVHELADLAASCQLQHATNAVMDRHCQISIYQESIPDLIKFAEHTLHRLQGRRPHAASQRVLRLWRKSQRV